MSYLQSLGWNERLQTEHTDNDAPETVPARVVAEHRGEYSVIDDSGEPYRAVLTGRGFAETDTLTRPAVGDWVSVLRDPGGTTVISRRFDRTAELVRKAAGRRTDPQVVAANVDIVFIVTWHDDFNLRRIERYLTFVWDGGSMPVIVFSKVDLCPDPAPYLRELADIAAGVPVEVVSGTEGTGVDGLLQHLGPGKTAVFVGSSGVGKSTLVNAILGEELQTVGEVRESDSTGRHVTTRRELFVTDRGNLIDTPGMRELGLWNESAAVEVTYGDIDELAEQCRFRDCSHQKEPGCGVLAAVKSGELDIVRLQAYRKQGREIAHMGQAKDAAARHANKLRGKRLSRMIKHAKRVKDPDKH